MVKGRELMRLIYTFTAGTLVAYGSVCVAAAIIGIGDKLPIWMPVMFFAGAAVCLLCAAVDNRTDRDEDRANSKTGKPRQIQTFDLRKEWNGEDGTETL